MEANTNVLQAEGSAIKLLTWHHASVPVNAASGSSMRYIAISLLFAMSSHVSAVELQVGQVLAYKTRPGESDSTITVLKVENYNDLGRVIHVRVEKIQIKNPVKGNIGTDIPHLPFKDAALQQSITKLVRMSSSIPEFQEGYDAWKKAYLVDQAGAFGLNVSATLNAMLNAKWEEKK